MSGRIITVSSMALETLRYSLRFLSSLPFITFLLPLTFLPLPSIFLSFSSTPSSSRPSSPLATLATLAKCNFTWLHFCHEDTLLAGWIDEGGKCRKRSFFPLSRSVIWNARMTVIEVLCLWVKDEFKRSGGKKKCLRKRGQETKEKVMNKWVTA